MYNRDNDPGFYAFWAAIIIVSVWGMFALINYKRQERISIEDRWWATSTAVKWQERDDDYVCRTNYDGDLECKWETTTTTHTRCSDSMSGRDLPVVWPDTPCVMHARDYIVKGQTYKLTYRDEKGKMHTTRFNPDLWANLEPGFERLVVFNFVKTIIAMGSE